MPQLGSSSATHSICVVGADPGTLTLLRSARWLSWLSC